ncbi:hypothetical protein D3C71_1367480 [compost metagenome]
MHSDQFLRHIQDDYHSVIALLNLNYWGRVNAEQWDNNDKYFQENQGEIYSEYRLVRGETHIDVKVLADITHRRMFMCLKEEENGFEQLKDQLSPARTRARKKLSGSTEMYSMGSLNEYNSSIR